MDFGWKKKTERLRVVILSGAHQIAKELPPGLSRILALYARVAQSGDGRGLVEEQQRIIAECEADPKPLWEPIEVYGWNIQVTMYLDNGQLWWLLHAARRNEREPSEKDVVFLDKILSHLGADPRRDMIIGPTSSPAGEPALPFGWWKWFNRWPLLEIQVNKDKHDKRAIRIVPLGTRETDGYRSLRKIDEDRDG